MLLYHSRLPLFTRAEQRWLLARMGDGCTNVAMLILIPCFGYEIFSCFSKDLFFSLFCLAVGIGLFLYHLCCRFWLEYHDSPTLRRAGFILCSAAGCAGMFAGLTVISAIPFYSDFATAQRVGRIFLFLCTGIVLFCRMGHWFSGRLIPARTSRLCRAGRWAEGLGALFVVLPGILLWLPSSDLPARFSLCFTIIALFRVISAAPLCCHAALTPAAPVILGRMTLRSLEKRPFAKSLAAVCVLSGAGLGALCPMLFGLGITIIGDTYRVVQLLLWTLPVKFALSFLFDRVSKSKLRVCCCLMGFCCVCFAAMAIFPGEATFFAAALTAIFLSGPVQRLCCRLLSAAFAFKTHPVWHAASKRLCNAGQASGLVFCGLLSWVGGNLLALIFCEICCAAACILLVVPARQAAHAAMAAAVDE